VSKAEFWMVTIPNATQTVAVIKTDGDERQVPVEVAFNISIPNPNTGKALGITVPEMDTGTEFRLRLTYRSLPESMGLSWLTPAQTAAKEKPFVYSLCQLNFCRDWAPMMDTPSQKITYNATITAPNGFVVSMSGNETGKTPFNDTWTTTTCM
jgi:leukotriene-A4 hydrolase